LFKKTRIRFWENSQEKKTQGGGGGEKKWDVFHSLRGRSVGIKSRKQPPAKNPGKRDFAGYGKKQGGWINKSGGKKRKEKSAAYKIHPIAISLGIMERPQKEKTKKIKLVKKKKKEGKKPS